MCIVVGQFSEDKLSDRVLTLKLRSCLRQPSLFPVVTKTSRIVPSQLYNVRAH